MELNVYMLSPKKVLFEGKAKSVVLPGEEGTFEVLPLHKSILTRLFSGTGVKEVGIFKKYSLSLTCEAQMEQLADFMYNIEMANQLLTIDKYEISPKAKESSVARCNITLSKIILP